jgi:hypothetical protein
MQLKSHRDEVDGSRLKSLSGAELLLLLKKRVEECTDPNPVPANAFPHAASVVEVLNAWIVCGRGDAYAAAARATKAKFFPYLY